MTEDELKFLLCEEQEVARRHQELVVDTRLWIAATKDLCDGAREPPQSLQEHPERPTVTAANQQ